MGFDTTTLKLKLATEIALKCGTKSLLNARVKLARRFCEGLASRRTEGGRPRLLQEQSVVRNGLLGPAGDHRGQVSDFTILLVQGDQIGHILAYWAVVYFGQFLNISE
jgi:hypothetical protein